MYIPAAQKTMHLKICPAVYNHSGEFDGATIAALFDKPRAEFWSSFARSFTILSLSVLVRQESRPA